MNKFNGYSSSKGLGIDGWDFFLRKKKDCGEGAEEKIK